MANLDKGNKHKHKLSYSKIIILGRTDQKNPRTALYRNFLLAFFSLVLKNLIHVSNLKLKSNMYIVLS
jgi:hypothetical protein